MFKKVFFSEKEMPLLQNLPLEYSICPLAIKYYKIENLPMEYILVFSIYYYKYFHSVNYKMMHSTKEEIEKMNNIYVEQGRKHKLYFVKFDRTLFISLYPEWSIFGKSKINDWLKQMRKNGLIFTKMHEGDLYLRVTQKGTCVISPEMFLRKNYNRLFELSLFKGKVNKRYLLKLIHYVLSKIDSPEIIDEIKSSFENFLESNNLPEDYLYKNNNNNNIKGFF